MPGGNICEENLEQRIERIRKRDEEIEKRHREAEADRLAALQANAMVKTTAPADDDWPKAHKYDKLDFTYDVKSDTANAAAVTAADGDDKKSLDETRPMQRPFKKFPEGQGPPADPSYNFLADAERDGKTDKSNNPANDTKNWRTNNNNNSNNSGSNNNRRNNGNNSSFNRGKNGGGAKGKNSMQKGKSSDEPILRKNDRERNNDGRVQRQTSSSDGMWRQRSVDENKDNKSQAFNSSSGKRADERQMNFKNDGNSKAIHKPSMQQRIISSKPEADRLQQKLSDLSIEKRGNITVSVTKDGEVKSVKLEAARAIGTGRVGGGALRQPQQQFVSNSSPIVMDANPNMPAMNNYPIIDQFQPQYQQQLEPTFEVPAPKPAAIVNGVPFKLPSVQDRLIKNRVFFDDKLKTDAQTGNGNTVAGNQ